jgi:hypothetical protein
LQLVRVKQIASETLLVETASKQVQNKIQHLSLSKPVSCSDTFCKIDYGSKNALSHYGWSLQRKEKNADKTLRILNRGYDAKQSRAEKTVIIRFIW